MPRVGKNTSVKAALKNEVDQSNFREVAQDTIKKYFDTRMLIDGMLWSRLVGLYEAILDRPQPMQPVERSLSVGSQFKCNTIVKKLFETGQFGFDEIEKWDVTVADKEQFCQLLGFSVDAFSKLPWASQATKDAADIEAAKLALKEKGEI